MKKLLSAAAALCIAFSVLPALPAGAEDIAAAGTAAEFDMDGLTADSDCIIYCYYREKQNGEYKFETIRMLKGSISETYFYVNSADSFGKDLVKDGRYVLFLDRKSSVYYSHDKYSPILDIKISADKRGRITSMTILGKPASNLPVTVSRLTKYISGIESNPFTGDDYIRSADVGDIIDGSDIIAKVTAAERVSDYTDGSGVYSCVLISARKGYLPAGFTAALFDKDISEGKNYYILLDKKDANGVYTLSSKNSIYSADDKEFEKTLESELE